MPQNHLSEFGQKKAAQDALAEREVASYDACKNAVEPADAGRPTTHAGTMARRRAYREGRLRSQAQEDNRRAKAAAAEAAAKAAAEAEAAAAAAAEKAAQGPQDAPAEIEAGSDAGSVEAQEEAAQAASDPTLTETPPATSSGSTSGPGEADVEPDVAEVVEAAASLVEEPTPPLTDDSAEEAAKVERAVAEGEDLLE